MLSLFMIWLSLRLDAEALSTTPDDILSAVAVLHSEDLTKAAREAPATLTLDVLHYVAWMLGLNLSIDIERR